MGARRIRSEFLVSALALAALALGTACGSSRGRSSGPLDARFVAVHNAFSAMGLVQIGPIEGGSLRSGGESRTRISLPAGCVTILALGGEGIQDLDATLLDPSGKPLAHDVTVDAEAVLRPCVEADDTYTLAIKAVSGEGSWVAATWAGGLGNATAPGGPADASVLPEANGTCDAPIPLGTGTVSGSTTHGEHENAGSCGPSDSRELVYVLDLPRRERVTIEVEARFDSVLYVRKDDCTDAEAEVACSDDAPDRSHSKVERVLEPGKYFVFVDGYGQDAGSFKMTVDAKEVVATSSDACRLAPTLLAGTTQTGTTAGRANSAEAVCGDGAKGADAAFRFDLDERSRVRVVEHSERLSPVIHMRRSCADPQSEIACAEWGAAMGDAAVTGLFDRGRYTVFADAHAPDAAGPFSLGLEVAPPSGTPNGSYDCRGPGILEGGSTGNVEGDTFLGRDDVAGTCGGAGAADTVYRLDVPRRSRLTASLDQEEARHLLVAWRRCGDRSTEFACGTAISEVVAPGTYFVGVDGTSPSALGRFSLHWALRDLSGQGSACGAALTLVPGQAVSSSTEGAGNAFDASCASENTVTGADRIFKITITRRATIHVAVKAAGFDVAVALRLACPDSSGGGPLELACTAETSGDEKITLQHVLEPGSYWIVVDGRTPKDRGPFTLEYTLDH